MTQKKLRIQHNNIVKGNSDCTYIGTLAKNTYLAFILEVYVLNAPNFYFYNRKYLHVANKWVPIPNFSDINLAFSEALMLYME